MSQFTTERNMKSGAIGGAAFALLYGSYESLKHINLKKNLITKEHAHFLEDVGETCLNLCLYSLCGAVTGTMVGLCFPWSIGLVGASVTTVFVSRLTLK